VITILHLDAYLSSVLVFKGLENGVLCIVGLFCCHEVWWRCRIRSIAKGDGCLSPPC